MKKFEGHEQEAIDIMFAMLVDSGWKYTEIIDYVLARVV